MSLWSKLIKPVWLDRFTKRNVVATDIGWAKRFTYVDGNGKTRHKDEIINTVHNLGTAVGAPVVEDIWHVSANGNKINGLVKTYISFNTPITSTKALKLAIANTAGGSAKVASDGTLFDANKLVFSWTPTVAGTYKVQAQTVANTATGGVDVKSTNVGQTNGNLTISTGVANLGGTLVITN